MRVLHIGKYFPPFSGGMENFLADLLDESSAQGLECAALVHDHSHGELPEQETLNNNLIVRVRSYGQLLFAPISPRFRGKLRTLIKSFQPDVIDIHLPNTSAFFLIFLIVARRIPWVIHWHSDVVFPADKPILGLAYKLYCPFEWYLLKRSRAIIATSPNYLQTSTTLKPYLQKCSVIPLTLNEARMPQLTNSLHEKARKLWNTGAQGDRPLRVLCIGRLTHYKGHDLLIDAVTKISQETASVSVLIVGEGELKEALEQQVADARLTARVKLLGHQSELILNALLANCDVFCLPSTMRTEAFGLVLLEAMYYGKPSIVSNIEGSGMTWVIGDAENGWHVPAGDADALAQKLIDLQQHPEQLTEAGQHARKSFDQGFSARHCVEQTIAVYEQCISQLKVPGH
ncbi:MAG: glycosyltransferase [Methylococcales bacterium]